MMRKAILGGVIAATAAVIASAPAQAAPSIYFTNGSFSYPYETTATVFQEFSSGTSGQAYTPAANESTTGVVTVRNGSVPGVTADPYGGQANQYLNIGGSPAIAGSYSVNFAAPVQFFSFILGSLDAYNSLTLTFANGASPITYSGTQIIGQPSVGPFNSGTTGRVSYDVGGGPNGITSATFSSTRAAFEIDSLASAVPEPATWGLMILGVGLAGAGLRSRRKERLAFA